MTLRGTYFNGKLQLDKPFKTNKPVSVLVTFEDAPAENRLTLSDFTFIETQELLKDVKGSFSDEVINERRQAL